MYSRTKWFGEVKTVMHVGISHHVPLFLFLRGVFTTIHIWSCFCPVFSQCCWLRTARFSRGDSVTATRAFMVVLCQIDICAFA